MALVITRKSQKFNPEAIESKFRVGNDVVITILGWKGEQVRISIDAPQAVAIYREEVYQRIRSEVGPDVAIGPEHHRNLDRITPRPPYGRRHRGGPQTA
jgi:carbon storage regulator CsrA